MKDRIQFLNEVYLNSFCFALTICCGLLLLYLIVRILFSSDQAYSYNKLTLIPYYSCFIYSLILIVETIFINFDAKPVGLRCLLFRYFQIAQNFCCSFAIAIHLFEFYLLKKMVLFQARTEFKMLIILRPHYMQQESVAAWRFSALMTLSVLS